MEQVELTEKIEDSENAGQSEQAEQQESTERRQSDADISLESSLAKTEQESVQCLNAVTRLQSLVKFVRHAASTGDLKGLHKGLESSRELLGRTAGAIDALASSWLLSESDEERLLGSGSFRRELINAAERAGLGLYEQETYLACYPSLLKELPKDRAVSIDRKTYRSIRPSHLVTHLMKLQKSGPRFNAAQFLDTLRAAYELKKGQRAGGVEKLVDIYRVLTVLPLAKREYSLQEFARDIYLLDASGETSARDGLKARLHAGATAARNRSNLLVVVTRDGEERTYYGIEFYETEQVNER